jgi:hypothetical protein
MMRRMMAKMCSAGECNPAAMCQQMMAFMGPSADTQAQATPEPSTSSEESARSAGAEVRQGCCAPPSGRAPKRP